ncbi:MAG: TlpA family protein disulfide reductase [Acidobacteria bacterium]|nr:TlpA family protein disulfide reductase [Acidobacteriota bacterium]
MRKALPILFVAALWAHAAAQSGRRISPPPTPPTPPPASERPATASRDGEEGVYAGTTSPPEIVSGYVPEGVMSREFKLLQEGRFKLSDFSGKVVVLNLWASWCGPCRREIPEIEEVRRDYAARGVEFVGLTAENPQADGERVRKFVRESRLGYRIGWIDRESARALMRGHNMIPQTFVIAGDGQIVTHLKGYAPGRTTDLLREAIERALEKR